MRRCPTCGQKLPLGLWRAVRFLPPIRYTCCGPIRGHCGQEHEDLAQALDHIAEDVRKCGRVERYLRRRLTAMGGRILAEIRACRRATGLPTDRWPVRLDGRPLTHHETKEIRRRL
jgi:hypothetical protein